MGARTAAQLLLEEFGKELNATLNATMAQRNLYFSIVFNQSNGLFDQPGSTLKACQTSAGRPS